MRMDELLRKTLELCREPAVTVTEGKLELVNPAAARAFPFLRAGQSIAPLLPREALEGLPEEAVCLVELAGVSYSLRRVGAGERTCLMFRSEEEPSARGFLSDGALNGLLSAQCNLELALRRLDDGTEPPGEAETLRAVLRRSASSLRRQLENLRLAVAFQEQTVFYQPRTLELVRPCRELADGVRDAMEDRGVELEFSAEAPSILLDADPALVERLLLNLLSNAYAHTPAGGRVRLRLAQAEDRVLLTVSDNGEGIPSHVLSEVFRRYASRAGAEDLSPAASGGLGLYIASGIARLHGGVLVIESRSGEGTTVRVSLPRQTNVSSLESASVPALPLADAIRTEFAQLLPLEQFTSRYSD